MRIIGLIALLFLSPAYAQAAAPTLTAYTVSHDTIYPSASVESGLATTTSIDIEFSEQVKASIKIMSASGTKIKTLYPSSGSSSDPVTNPKSKIWDGTNTAGTRVADGTYTILISATSTAPAPDNLSMTDASKTITVASADITPPAPQASSSRAPPEYIPIPTLQIITSSTRTVSSGAEVAFTAIVYDSKGNKRDDATVMWSFGDGMRRTGTSVFHQYYEPGEYLAVVRAKTSDGGNVQKEVVVTVKDASIKISSVSSRGIALTNTDSRTLDLSLWRLSAGGREFKIPEDTQILAGRTILFPSQVIELPITDTASLLYPSGEVAMSYPKVAVVAQANTGVQPTSRVTGYEQVQKVEKIINQKTDAPSYEKAVLAPAASTELAAVGAALPPEPPAPASRAPGIFKSPWTLGLLGVMALSAAAFILL